MFLDLIEHISMGEVHGEVTVLNADWNICVSLGFMQHRQWSFKASFETQQLTAGKNWTKDVVPVSKGRCICE